ncbi:MAG: glucose-6-phosphate isomerase [Actinobacteria bacterium]|nr:glucose-6-phosphate isomerase [Actinomycetota bacterium]
MDRLGPLAEAVDGAVQDLTDRGAVRRMWTGDHTLWQDDPTEVADRLGWLHVADDLLADRDRLDLFASTARSDGITHAVVMGMGGSSLFPEVLARTFAPAGIELRVLDTTDPAAVRRVGHECPAETTLFIASSKSGSTIETRSHLATFWARTPRPDRFVAITDPGTSLARTAVERGFRALFENRPDIGGRYSALSHFGMVPAALSGVDWTGILAAAQTMAARLGPEADPAGNPGVRLGAALGCAVRAGRDKVTLVIDTTIESFGLWLEQLLAESTGKQGTGVVPIAGERLGPPEVYGDDRLFVAIGEHHGLDRLAKAGHPVVDLPFDGPLDLGGQVLLWEVATALCGAVLGINPFDQPNVAEAKEATAKVLAEGPPDIPVEPLGGLLERVRPGDYVAIQAYVDPESGVVDAVEDARTAIRDRLRVATTVGLGPRFLHSTGQLHKGGPPTGVFVQVVGEDPEDEPIPDAGYGFSTLEHAQADGDWLTLRRHGLRVARVTIDDLMEVTR